MLEKKKRRENICNENEDCGNTYDFEELLRCLSNINIFYFLDFIHDSLEESKEKKKWKINICNEKIIMLFE